MALVQEGPSLSLMACKYSRLKERAVPVVDSIKLHKLLDKGRSMCYNGHVIKHDLRKGLIGKDPPCR